MSQTSHLFYQTASNRPFLDRGKGIYLYDTEGNRYIDGSSGAMVSNIGHSHPAVLAAMKAQMDKASFGYRLHFKTEVSEQLAARTAALMPEGLDRVFFVSGGSEAVETAIKFARQTALAKGEETRWKVISRFPSYHGCTLGALALTGYSPLHAPFAPMLQDMPKIAAPTCYLDHDHLTDEERGIKYAELLRAEILAQGPKSVLAFVMEPVGGASTGALVAPDSYHHRVRDICDEYGVTLIYDEVMTGAGRTGRFLGCEHWGLTPDIIAMSKGFAAGYAPLGAIVARAQDVDLVMQSGGFQHGFTYAGNPLACAAGLAVLDVIDQEGLVDNARLQGAHLKAALEGLMAEFGFIIDVRGKGLLLAFEFGASQQTKAVLPPSLNAHQKFVDMAFEEGLVVYSRRTRGGREGDHILVCPPLCVTRSQIDEIMVLLRKTLRRFEAALLAEGLQSEGAA